MAQKFNQIINKLLTLAAQKSEDDRYISQLDLVKRRFALLKNIGGAEGPIEAGAPVLVRYSEQIINGDEDFIKNVNIKEEVKRFGETDDFLPDFLLKIRTLYFSCDEDEKREIMDDLCDLLELSSRYLLTKN